MFNFETILGSVTRAHRKVVYIDIQLWRHEIREEMRHQMLIEIYNRISASIFTVDNWRSYVGCIIYT